MECPIISQVKITKALPNVANGVIVVNTHRDQGQQKLRLYLISV